MTTPTNGKSARGGRDNGHPQTWSLTRNGRRLGTVKASSRADAERQARCLYPRSTSVEVAPLGERPRPRPTWRDLPVEVLAETEIRWATVHRLRRAGLWNLGLLMDALEAADPTSDLRLGRYGERHAQLVYWTGLVAQVWAVWAAAHLELTKRRCKRCGCTEDNCSVCIERTGGPCLWIGADLCSACVPARKARAK